MCNCEDLGYKKLIRITNFIGVTTELTVRCKSKQHDAGYWALPPAGSFEYVMEEGRIYSCFVQWQGSTAKIFQIDGRRAKFAENCYVIKTSGPCLCECKDASCSYTKCDDWDISY